MSRGPGEPADGSTRTNPSAAKHLPPGKVLAGRYRLGEILGVGGMGVVYAAHDLELELPVAVKLLRPEMAGDDRLRERFRREIILARQVSHPHVVRIHDLYHDGDLRFLTMDLVRGRSLRDVLRSDGPLAAEQAVSYALQLARALEAAHEQAVVHRDLKPENVLLEPVAEADGATSGTGSGRHRFGVVRISDFGIARSLGSGVRAGGLTATGTVVGSLDYMSPEQARGGEIDGRSDVYQLGLILHEMLTGELPFRRGSDLEMLAQRISTSPSLERLDRAPAPVPGWLRKVLQNMLQRDPDRRYDAATVVRALESEGSRTGSTSRPRTLVWALAAVVTFTVMASGWWWSATSRTSVEPAQTTSESSSSSGTGTDDARVSQRTAPPKHSLAVLPLTDHSELGQLGWVSRGGAEMLARSLAENPELRVVDSFRVFRLLDDLGIDTPGDSGALPPARQADLAELLDVDHLVTGVVRASGDGLRIELRLTDPRPGGLRRDLGVDTDGDFAGASGRLAEQLQEALAVEPADAGDAVDAASDAARSAYDLGLERLLAGADGEAATLLRSAVTDSPEFVDAWIRLSDAYERQGLIDAAADALGRAARAAGVEDGEPASGSGRRAMEIAAREADLRGDAERSQALWQRLVERYPQDIEARVRWATSLGEAGQLDRACERLHEVVAVDSKHPRAWYLLSKYSIQAGDLNRAVDEFLVRALVIQNQLDNDPGRADVVNAMGVAYHRLGRLGLAETRYAEAADLRRRVGDLRGLAATLRNLGSLAAIRGDYETAESRFDEAEACLETLGDRYGVASLANQRGLLEEERGNYRRALELFRRALQLRRDLGDRRVLAESFNNVGYAYYLLGEYDNAGVYWRQALQGQEAAGNRQGEVYVRQSLGLLHLAQGRWDESPREFLRALESGRELELPDAQAVSHGYLGRLAQLQGRYGAALEAYDEALAILREVSDPRGLAEFGLLRAEALFEIGSDDEMRRDLQPVREALDQAENREQLAILRWLEGRLALRQGEVERAGELVRESCRHAEASHSVVAGWKCRWAVSEVDLASGQVDAAADTLSSLAEQAESLGHAELRLLAAESLGRARLTQGRPESAKDAFSSGLRVLTREFELADAHRLHRGLAAAHAALGDAEAAAISRQRASAEIERLVSEMDPARRADFQRMVGAADHGE